VPGQKGIIRFIDFMRKASYYLVSDEIHSDFIRPPHKHNSLLTLSNNVIACFFAKQNIQLAGMSTSMIVIPINLTRKIPPYFKRLAHSFGNLFGTVATENGLRTRRRMVSPIMGVFTRQY
jgi:bifunctional pyridoxal-dependent enzyme with beta-cystathionase and maltose regulon repressor activities